MVVGLHDGDQYKAYVFHQIESNKVINDKINNRLFSIYPRMTRVYSPIIGQNNASTNKIIDNQTGCE
jgi:hypothetical protein